MTTADDEHTQAVVTAVLATKLENVERAINALTALITDSRQENVLRTEWELRNQHVDTKFANQGKEIADLRTELTTARQFDQNRRPNWTAVGMFVLAVVAGSLALFERMAL